MVKNTTLEKSALVIIDMQVGVVPRAWQRNQVIAAINLAVGHARKAGIPIIWVQHHDDELPKGSDDWKLVPELAIAHGDMYLEKSYNSIFEETKLQELLTVKGIKTLVISGAASNWCIRASAYGALDRGFNIVLVADGHTCTDMTLEDGSIVEAQSIIKDLNIAMYWLRYPGRTNTTLATEEIIRLMPQVGATE